MTSGTIGARRGTQGESHCRQARILLLLCTTVCLLLGATIAVFGCADKAWADEAPDDVPRSASGSCYIGDTWMVGEQSFFTIPSFDGILSEAVPSSTFECLNHTAAAPEHVSASYEASLTDCSIDGGWVEYYVTITPPDVTDGVTYNEYGLVGYQRVGGTVRLAWNFKGGIALQKESALPEVTEENSCYSLEGAVYGVYSSEEAAQTGDAAEALATYTTDSAGTWDSGAAFTPGSYYIKELTAPVGFELSDEVLGVAVSASQTTHATAHDMPILPQAEVRVAKRDAQIAHAGPQGDASLEGAEVTFRYYAGHYDESDLPDEPTRTWIMKTNAEGVASVSDGEAMRASGDDFYYDANGQVVVPLGTVTAMETKAPEGYKLDDTWSEHVVLSAATDDATMNLEESAVRGGLELTKYSRHLERTGPAGDGSLANATFEIVNASDHPVVVNGTTCAAGQVVCTLRTNASGVASTGARTLPYGTYTVSETGTSDAGYLLDDASLQWSATFSIREDGRLVALDDKATSISNDEARGNVELIKADGDTGSAIAQGDATLAGARFHIINRSAASVPSPETGAEVAPGEVVCTIVTDESGRASTAAADVNGWSVPEDFKGKALVYGSYEIREAEAPSYGYLPNEDWSATFEVRSDGQVISLGTSDDVMRGRIIVGKISRENGSYLEQGAASLSGWSFEIVNRSASRVVVDGALYEPGEVVKTISTDPVEGRFVADTGEGCLPYGTYEVHEVQTMRAQDNGYLFDEASQTWSRIVEIRADGQTADLTDEGSACPNQVVRGDFELVKAGESDMVRLSGIPFKVTSTTTGEWHVIVTDRNGQASTSSSWCAHASKTNGNDAALREDGSVDEALLDDEAGVWFSGRVDAPCAPNENKGALPFDTYTVEELRTSANEGLELVSFEVVVYRDATSIDVGTIDDAAIIPPNIGTQLSDAVGNKVVAATENAQVVDTVEYSNLIASDSYTLVGELYLSEDGQATELVASSEQTFEPSLPHGKLEVPFEFDASAYAGRTLVCFERLLDSSGTEIASHADATDEGQSVAVPTMGTSLTDVATGAHVVTFDEAESVELVDTVEYAGLAPNRVYTLTATLYDKASASPILDARGLPVNASRTFTPTTAQGSIDVPLSFSLAPDSKGKSVVCFESLTCHGVEYAAHADIADEGQTVVIASIGTTLTDADTGEHVIPEAGPVSLVDTVTYDNLVPGRSYTAKAVLYDQERGEALAIAGEGGGALTLESSATFTPEAPSGTVQVTFELDAEQLPTRTVCFERVLDETGRIVAVHADLDDAGQTVAKPSIATTIADVDTGNRTVASQPTFALVDTVAYKGLVAGREYTAYGTLVDKATGKTVLDSNGEVIQGRAQFTPTGSDGSVEVPFEFNAALEGKTLVAFESLESEGREYATHADLSNANQTAYVPSIRTTLIDAQTGTHGAAQANGCTLVDTVAFEGLEPGKTYTVSGELYDKASGKPLMEALDKRYAGISEKTAVSVEFTPAASSGTVTVTFEVKADLAGRDVVAFERLVDNEGRTLAIHEDINDLNQTVSFPSPPESKTTAPEPSGIVKATLAKTGDALPMNILLLFIPAGALGLLGAALAVRHLEREAEITLERGRPRNR